SESVQELAVDLASFQNIEGGAERASEALTKAILGETEMAKSLGIVIQQNTKEFNLQVKSLMETEGLTKLQARSQVILTQAYEQSKNAIGDFARTQMETANMQRQITSQTEDISVKLGSVFLPIIKEVTKNTLAGAKALNDFLQEEKNLAKIQDTIAKIGAGFEVAFGFFKEIGTAVFQETKKAIELSESVQELAVDLASFQNIEGGAERASEALTKAILGETEMAKSLGIVIQQNTKEFNLQVKSLMETEGLTKLQARSQVILTQAYEQSKNAIGDFARTQMETANMQRQITSQTEDISVKLGSV
ncbi:unnamed protein product, partial [marine sediment metagenome]